jgi:hypothetical protein
LSDGEAKAIRFLQREVPKWSRENGCFSCHNNGDAARALFAAVEFGYEMPRNALRDTVIWLSHPERWSENKGDPGFSDQRLADIQFASALRLWQAAQPNPNTVDYQAAVQKAALRIAAAQDPDGSWRIEPQNPVGSPATYGTALATFMAWATLQASGAADVDAARRRASSWLAALKPVNVPAAAVILMASTPRDLASRTNLDHALSFLRQAQTASGGWGPYADSPPEVFDTALALLGIKSVSGPATQEMVKRGRDFLQETQRSDGGWAATTRPAGGVSYAQEISTTGWATLALLATGR